MNIFPLGKIPISDSTQISAAATLAHTFYTQGAAVAAKAYTILGCMVWASGLAAAGTWTAAPTTIDVTTDKSKLPGDEIQIVRTDTGAVNTGATTLPADDTIPQITEGNEYMTQAITPVSAANILDVDLKAMLSTAIAGNNQMIAALFRDATANALTVSANNCNVQGDLMGIPISWRTLAGSTAASTFRLRAGAPGAGTTTFNGTTSARLFGGTYNSFMQVKEVMA